MMQESNRDKWLKDLDAVEGKCICMRTKTAYSYFYPFDPDVFETGMKVCTRDGRLVKNVRVGGKGSKAVVVGMLDGSERRWDAAGKAVNAYTDSPDDLFIQERYLYSDWRVNIGMSNAEWAVRYGRPHPTVKIPK